MSFKCRIDYVFPKEPLSTTTFLMVMESYNLICQLYNGKIDMQTLQTNDGALTFDIIFESEYDCLQCHKCVNQLSELANVLSKETAENILKIWKPFFDLELKHNNINK